MRLELSENEWHELYAETGITLGTEIDVQNQGLTLTIFKEAETSPASVLEGKLLRELEFFLIKSSVGVWVRSPKKVILEVTVV